MIIVNPKLKMQTQHVSMKNFALVFLLSSTFTFALALHADDGHRLWLKYDVISNAQKLKTYKSTIKGWMVLGDSPTIAVASKELQTGLEGLFGAIVPHVQ